ncbi:MAG: B3/B4 domain-containing protein [Candidatus Bathyarchaeia archaeon]
MPITLHPELRRRFPGLEVQAIRLADVEVKKEKPELEIFKEEVVRRARGRWTLEGLREHPNLRAYRDFFWRIGIDPTKVRPSAEALIRRILHGNPLPRINTLVDAYNLASVETALSLAAFDEDKLRGQLLMRMAEGGESFLGIGMSRPVSLRGGEIIITDSERPIAIYPYRDAEHSKVTEETRNVLILVCGVPGISGELINQAGRLAVDYIKRFCGGIEAVHGG